MKKHTSLIILVVFLSFLFSSCSKTTVDGEIPNDAIVSVNGEFVLMSEIEPVLEQYEGTDVTYEKIVDDTILEILVIQQAESFDIFLSDEDIERIVADYQAEHPEYYSESIRLYGEDALKKKLRDSYIFDMVKNHVIANVLKYDSETIQEFRSQDGFNGYLDDISDETIVTTLQLELEEFAFRQWMNNLKENAEIIYY